MADFEGDGAPVRVNRRARAGWLIGLLIGVAVVFGVLGIVLKQSIEGGSDYKVGHEHEHQEGGDKTSADPTPPRAGLSAKAITPMDRPSGPAPEGHSADDGHGH